MSKKKEKVNDSREETREHSPEHSQACPLCACRDYFARTRQDHESLQHFHNAQVEFLRGMRSILDEGISWLQKEAPPKKERVTKIVVE